MSDYSDSHYFVSGITRVCVFLFMLAIGLCLIFEMPKVFESDDLKRERIITERETIKTKRIEMFLIRIDNMDEETTAKLILENLETIEKVFGGRLGVEPVAAPAEPKIKP